MAAAVPKWAKPSASLAMAASTALSRKTPSASTSCTCKRNAAENSIGRQDIQAFAGSLDGVRATKGIFFTTSTFTKGALEYVEKISKRIILIDGQALAKLMIRHNVGVRTRTTYEIKRADEDYFSE